MKKVKFFARKYNATTYMRLILFDKSFKLSWNTDIAKIGEQFFSVLLVYKKGYQFFNLQHWFRIEEKNNHQLNNVGGDFLTVESILGMKL